MKPSSFFFHLFLPIFLAVGVPCLAHAGKSLDVSAQTLHVDGPNLKDPSGKIVILRGINHHGFLDVPDGGWDPEGAPLYSGMGQWNPDVVKRTLDQFHRLGFNVVRFHTIVNWWKTDPITYQDPYRNVTYPESYRKMMEDTIRWAGERGLYVIFDFYALNNEGGRQSGQESLPWPPWGKFPDVVKDKGEFESLWRSVAQTLGAFPNVLFELYNEPHGDSQAQKEWFGFVNEVLPIIRSWTPNPVIVQWDYNCWVNLDYPPPQYSASTLDWIQRNPISDPNIIYGFHLYRNSGGGGPGTVHRSGPPLVNLWEKADLEKAYGLALIPQVAGQDRKPLLVTEVGAFLKNGGEDKAHELEFLRNTLSLLKEWNIGYVGWGWASDEQISHGMLHDGEPNEAGKILLDSLRNP